MIPTFVCSPPSAGSLNRLRRIPEDDNGRVLSTCPRFAKSRTLVSCRMRNRGGFRLPPHAPQDLPERKRAIELLGNMTQRKHMKRSTKIEIEALVGGVPKSREVAQQWKVALQRTPNARLIHLASPTAFKRRNEVLRRIRLPEQNKHVGRCFVLLGCLERRYRSSQPPSTRVLEELEEKMGGYPVDVNETHHFRKALTALQKERRSEELRPRRIPLENMDELLYAKMLLGSFAVRGSVGLQSDRLQQLIGVLPRNRHVAESWKKIIAAAIRKKTRQDRVASRLTVIEQKRRERSLRRQQGELESHIDLQILADAGTRGIGDDRENAICQDSDHPTAAVEEEAERTVSFVSRLQTMLGVFFGGQR